MKDMFLVEESAIPSALVTKENLMGNKIKSKIKKNRPPISKGRIESSSRLSTGGEGIETVDKERSTPFLPPIIHRPSKTRGGTPWKWSDSRERQKASYSVLSLRDGEARANAASRSQTLESLQKSVIPQAKTALPRQRYHQNLKFWKGSKQHSRKGRKTGKSGKNKQKIIRKETNSKMDNPRVEDDPTWSQNFSYLEEIDKNENGFYARQLALRERLIEFEAMHYKEAVTRINRYREKLRRPLLSRSRALTVKRKEREKKSGNIELQTLQVEGDKDLRAQEPMFRMSPDKEWKPNIQQKVLFSEIAKKRATETKENAEKQSERAKPQQHRTFFNKLRSSKTATTGEQAVQNARSDSKTDNKSNLKEDLGITAVGLTQSQGHKRSSQQSRKQNPVEKFGAANEDQFGEIGKPRTEETPSTRSRLGVKLRLLLNKSAHTDNDDNSTNDDHQRKHQATEQKKKHSSYFRTSISRYQLSNSDRFPSITRIGSLTTAKGSDGEQKFVMQGISDESSRARLSTSLSNRIMERMKNRTNAENQPDAVARPKTFGNIIPEKSITELPDTHKKTMTIPIPQSTGGTAVKGVAIAKVQILQGSNSKPGDPQSSNSHITQLVKKSRNLQRAMKSHKKALKQQKVLKVAFVESANEIEKRQKALQEAREKEVMGKHMMFDSKKLAITSLTAAILNSEVLLRAPSSSPVDFLRHHAFQSKMAKYKEPSHKEGDSDMDSKYAGYIKHDAAPLNLTDGLSPINRPLEFLGSSQTDAVLPSISDLVDLHGIYEAMKMQRPPGGLKTSNSMLGSLQILQRQHLDKILLKKQPFYYNPFHYERQNPISQNSSVPLYVMTAAKAVHKPSDKRGIKSTTDHKQADGSSHTEGNKTLEKKIFHNSPFPEFKKRSGEQSHAVFNDFQTVGYSGIRGVTVSTSAQPIAVTSNKSK